VTYTDNFISEVLYHNICLLFSNAGWRSPFIGAMLHMGNGQFYNLMSNKFILYCLLWNVI